MIENDFDFNSLDELRDYIEDLKKSGFSTADVLKAFIIQLHQRFEGLDCVPLFRRILKDADDPSLPESLYRFYDKTTDGMLLHRARNVKMVKVQGGYEVRARNENKFFADRGEAEDYFQRRAETVLERALRETFSKVAQYPTESAQANEFMAFFRKMR